MKRSANSKFPHSAHLFKFCQKVLLDQKKGKVHDQEIGSILSFNPSDCSHWKKGQKNIRSVFALEKLSSSLKIENSILLDIASGHATIEEAFYEYKQNLKIRKIVEQVNAVDPQIAIHLRQTLFRFVDSIHQQCSFDTAPLYLPEVLQVFSFIKTQPVDMVEKLSRILKVKAGQYCIQFAKGDLRSQTRMSTAMDLARILFEGERSRFPELGSVNSDLLLYEEMLFVANLLLPKALLQQEIQKIDIRRNLIVEISNLFWVPKSLVSFQLQEMMRRS